MAPFMLDHEIVATEQHERFVRRCRAARLVWGLKSSAGWCLSPANGDSDRQVMPFWSDRAYAQQCAHGDWAEYEPAAIPLDEFLAAWLPGLERDGFLVGTNWNAHLVGLEVEPTRLAAELQAGAG